MTTAKTTKRNRDMLKELEDGMSVETLASKYGLSSSTVSAILAAERNRRAVSPDPVYKAFRQ
jgi:Mor family transcriptional regulator